MGEDSFAVDTTVHGITEQGRHPDRIRASEALKVTVHNPHNRPSAREAFDHYRNPNIDGIREQALDQVDARESIASIFKSAKDNDPDFVAYTSPDGNLELGTLNADILIPGYNANPEKGKVTIGGGFDSEATIAKTTLKEQNIGELANGRLIGTVGTVNANTKAEFKLQTKGVDKEVSALISGGAESMLVNGRIEYEMDLTLKTVGDVFVDAYNEHIDPLVNNVAGRDMPELPPVPEAFDHGFVFSGHLEAGIGAAAKSKLGFSAGNGNGMQIHKEWKVGAPIAFGQASTFGVK